MVALGVLRVPEHWQQRSVRYQGQDAELRAWPNAVWAERVEVGMTRRLAQALRQQAGAAGWWTGDDAQATRRLLVDVTQLDVDPQAGQLRAVVTWRLLDRRGQTLGWGSLADSRSVQVQGAVDEAQALGQWLDGLAAQLAPRVMAALATPPAH